MYINNISSEDEILTEEMKTEFANKLSIGSQNKLVYTIKNQDNKSIFEVKKQDSNIDIGKNIFFDFNRYTSLGYLLGFNSKLSNFLPQTTKNAILTGENNITNLSYKSISTVPGLENTIGEMLNNKITQKGSIDISVIQNYIPYNVQTDISYKKMTYTEKNTLIMQKKNKNIETIKYNITKDSDGIWTITNKY